MLNHFLLTQFFEACCSFFPCRWGISPLSQENAFPIRHKKSPLIGYINPLYPPLITIIERPEDYHLLHASHTYVAILANPSAFLCEYPQRGDIPLIITCADSIVFLETLFSYLSKQLAPTDSQHGVMMDIFGKGVLIMGPSGIGKSHAALHLIARGHRLISDDNVCFYRSDPLKIVGFCDPRLLNLLEIRGLGVIDVQQWYGPCSTLSEKSLDLVITLAQDPTESDPRPLKKELGEKIILGVSISHLILPLAFMPDLAMLLESAVKFAFSTSSTKVDSLLSPA